LFGVDGSAARNWRDAAESLIRGHKDADIPQAVKIESNRQLQRIQRPQALIHSVLDQ
jgi:hypothetical protein